MWYIIYIGIILYLVIQYIFYIIYYLFFTIFFLFYIIDTFIVYYRYISIFSEGRMRGGEGVHIVKTRMSCSVCLKLSCLLQELYVLDLHKDIVIGEELTPESLRAYLMSIYMIKSSLLPSIDEPKFMRLWEMVMSRCISNAPAIRLQSTRVDLEKMALRSPTAMAGLCSSTQRICAFWQ